MLSENLSKDIKRILMRWGLHSLYEVKFMIFRKIFNVLYVMAKSINFKVLL